MQDLGASQEKLENLEKSACHSSYYKNTDSMQGLSRIMREILHRDKISVGIWKVEVRVEF